MLFSDKVEVKFNWLNKTRAASITAICKEIGGNVVTVKRLAQEQRALGVCKLLVAINGHSWRESTRLAQEIKKAVSEAGLVDGLTFQD